MAAMVAMVATSGSTRVMCGGAASISHALRAPEGLPLLRLPAATGSDDFLQHERGSPTGKVLHGLDRLEKLLRREPLPGILTYVIDDKSRYPSDLAFQPRLACGTVVVFRSLGSRPGGIFQCPQVRLTQVRKRHQPLEQHVLAAVGENVPFDPLRRCVSQ